MLTTTQLIESYNTQFFQITTRTRVARKNVHYIDKPLEHYDNSEESIAYICDFREYARNMQHSVLNSMADIIRHDSQLTFSGDSGSAANPSNREARPNIICTSLPGWQGPVRTYRLTCQGIQICPYAIDALSPDSKWTPKAEFWGRHFEGRSQLERTAMDYASIPPQCPRRGCKGKPCLIRVPVGIDRHGHRFFAGCTAYHPGASQDKNGPHLRHNFSEYTDVGVVGQWIAGKFSRPIGPEDLVGSWNPTKCTSLVHSASKLAHCHHPHGPSYSGPFAFHPFTKVPCQSKMTIWQLDDDPLRGIMMVSHKHLHPNPSAYKTPLLAIDIVHSCVHQYNSPAVTAQAIWDAPTTALVLANRAGPQIEELSSLHPTLGSFDHLGEIVREFRERIYGLDWNGEGLHKLALEDSKKPPSDRYIQVYLTHSTGPNPADKIDVYVMFNKVQALAFSSVSTICVDYTFKGISTSIFDEWEVTSMFGQYS